MDTQNKGKPIFRQSMRTLTASEIDEVVAGGPYTGNGFGGPKDPYGVDNMSYNERT